MKKWLWMILGCALATAVGAKDAHAQKADDAVTAEARVLAEKGAALLGKKEWDKACAAYQAAWALKQHYSIAGDMAVCETELGRYRQAAEHLAFTVDAMSREVGARAEERAAVQAALDKVLTKIVALTISVNEAGAEVTVDGSVVGTSPLPKVVYLDPGQHIVKARLEGWEAAEEAWDGAAGSKKSVALVLKKKGDVGPIGGTTEPLAWRTPAIVVGGVVGAGLLVGGVVTTVLAKGAAGDADDALASLSAGGNSDPCGGAGEPEQCKSILSSNQDSDRLANLSVPLFVAGGALLVGTAVFAVLTAPNDPASAVTVRPTVGLDGWGVGVSGAF